jgi:tRNA (mo5U34)-methyltransferase
MIGETLRAADELVWYHTLELAPDVVTPGYYDLRGVVERLPWPDVRGARALDVGTFDGFFAFELERRGAASVVAIDLDDYAELDWPPRHRARGLEEIRRWAGPERGRGFRLAREALGSRVERVAMNVYDLSPESLGPFDVVVMGSILLHLRDPMRALDRVRTVCRGWLLVSDVIDPLLTALHRRRPLLEVKGNRDQWWAPNVAGLRRMLVASGFDVVAGSGPFVVPYGPGFGARAEPPAEGRDERPRWRRRRPGLLARAARRLVVGPGPGVPHAAFLARPAV